MKKKLFKKSVVMGIIILFLGAGVIPAISGNINDGINSTVSKKADISSVLVQPLWVWAKMVTGNGSDDVAYHMAGDGVGNSYITGYFSGYYAIFNPDSGPQIYIWNPNPSTRDVFVAKFNPSGTCLWANSAGGPGDDEGWGIAYNAKAHTVCITGYFNSADVAFGTTPTLTNAKTGGGTNDIFFALLDPDDGNFLGAINAGGPDDDKGYAVTVDAHCGCTYVTGYFCGKLGSEAHFGTYIPPLTSNGGSRDVFVAHPYWSFSDPAGVSWATVDVAGGPGFDCGYGIAITPTWHTLCVTGWFDSPPMTFKFPGNPDITVIWSGSNDIFVAQYNWDNGWIWAHSAGNTLSDCGFDVAVDASGYVYVTGWFKGLLLINGIDVSPNSITSNGGDDAFVLSFDPTGIFYWASSAGGPGIDNDNGCDITVTPGGIAKVTGKFSGTTISFKHPSQLVQNLVYNYGGDNIFVAALYPNGNWKWEVAAGGPNYDYGYGISVDNTGGTYFAGRFHELAYFGDLQALSDPLGLDDVYVAKLQENNSIPQMSTITGQKNGVINTPYDYTVQTTDPDQDEVQYTIDWGDNTTNITGFTESGKQVVVSHTWDTKGTYSIRVKAMDAYGLESDWATLTVTMPCSFNKQLPQFLELLFQRFPHAFPLLRQLMGY